MESAWQDSDCVPLRCMAIRGLSRFVPDIKETRRGLSDSGAMTADLEWTNLPRNLWCVPRISRKKPFRRNRNPVCLPNKFSFIQSLSIPPLFILASLPALVGVFARGQIPISPRMNLISGPIHSVEWRVYHPLFAAALHHL